MRHLLVVVLALFPLAVAADEGVPRIERGRSAGGRHYLLTTQHTLRTDERADLEAAGVDIQEVLPDHRYIVRAADADAIADDPRVASIEPLAIASKIDRSAYREAARAKPFARVRILFHADVAFDEAEAAIENVGGSIDQPFATGYLLPQRVAAAIPFASLEQLASDDRVRMVFGTPRRPRPLNDIAALDSHVTPLYSAPYNLSGNGVVLSEFEFATAYAAHPEFATGRLITHVTGSDAESVLHATHVAGTMIAKGIDPKAKGMAPAATLHEFDANQNYPDVMVQTKASQLPPLGIVADNNSWGFPLSWQQDPDNGSWVWEGGQELYGAYDSQLSTPYDAMAKTSPVLFVQSSGNDGANGDPFLGGTWSTHEHTDDNGNILANETFCYSLDGTGKDCVAPPCTSTPGHCETVHHPTHTAFQTIGPTATLKDVLAIGATNPDGQTIARFSSRGPTADGRVKPDLVAVGVAQYSTAPGGGYQNLQGTSMAAPVVTGMTADLVEQYRKSFGGQNPLPIVLKTLLIEGAIDIGNPGPDYTFGWGLANAQAAVDLIIADNNTGSRIRVANISQGQTVQTPLTVSSTQNLRVVVGWVDPEVLLSGTDPSARTLVNEIDLKVVDPSGNTVLPYVLDKTNVSNNATHGVNTVDNTQEVEIANAAPGTYNISLTGTNIASGPNQQYVLIANAQLGATSIPCSDPFEPNDTAATAFGYLVNGATINAALCTATDVDFYKIKPTTTGPVSVTITATDTALTASLSQGGQVTVGQPLAPGNSETLSINATAGQDVLIEVQPSGTLGTNRGYTLVPHFAMTAPPRHRSSRH